MTKFFSVLLAGGMFVATISAAQAAGGCGWGWHRGPLGGCVRNGAAVVVTTGGGPTVVVHTGVRACPVGWHLGPEGHRCWRN